MSATPPKLYPPTIIPTKMIAFSHPFSLDDKCKSHDDGKTKETA